MTDLEAIERRVSRRAYLPEPLDPEQVQALELLARQCSRDAELNIRLVQDDPAAFRGLRRSYGRRPSLAWEPAGSAGHSTASGARSSQRQVKSWSA